MQLDQLLRVFGGQVVGLAEVFFQVVQLPRVIVEIGFLIGQADRPGQAVVPSRSHPALVVDRAVSEHLKKLCGMEFRGVGTGETGQHGAAIHR